MPARIPGSLPSGSTPNCSIDLQERGRSLAGSDLHRRHASVRQHACRADSGQPSPGPRRRRTGKSGSAWCPHGLRRRAAGRFLFRNASPALDADGLRRLGPGLSGKACRRSPRAKRGSPTRCRVTLAGRFDPSDLAQRPHHPHGARSGRYLRFVFLQSLRSAMRISYDLAELGSFYRGHHELDGPLAIGSAGRRHARSCLRGRSRQPGRASPATARLLRSSLGRPLPELS